ncbi:TIGR03757 family integrating conjugative element protein [Ectothiorhodospira haloalkaliphila]|uniref:TIGR03757 family integrating conjugative element protein n=1 Tax=Ectothiorhodospira haloalkaliphila TaxID=421628 RepID=UPI001EE91820|nr:TIGR03757 family integrating conjugative element protein [Ectothiorhodospira haloalkaliphila]MCG5526388.1 TIGR03757 family integrating conjugative element protein [Ectothiorhodospira haloalkaliphila]
MKPIQADPGPSQIEVFVAPEQADQVSGQGAIEARYPGLPIQVFDLGAAARFEDQLSEGLSADPATAQAQVRQRLQDLGPEIEARLREAFGGLVRADQLGIDRLPAVVFDDGQAVVYGVTDLPTALSHYRRWRDGP